MNKIRFCPICLHHKNKLLYIQKFAEHFEHKIVSCLFCSFVYVNNTPSKKYYDTYYKNQSKYEGIRSHEIHEEFTYRTIKKYLKKYIHEDARILDVGCSTGRLLFFIKKQGYSNILGIEPAPKCKQIAKDLYSINIETTVLEKYKPKSRFDFIILSGVLEHLVDPKETIEKIFSLLNNKGILFIGVPDAGEFYKSFKEPFGEFSTEHINFFTKSSLYLLLNKFSNLNMTSDKTVLLSLWLKGSEGKRSINEYIKRSRIKMNNVNKVLDSISNHIIVWGAGALTQRLLKTTNIRNKIFKFVDSNKNLIGKQIEGIDIISPNELNKYNNPILISSFSFKDEIIKEIKKRKIKNQIITF